MKFIVDRSKWYRGKGILESRLLRSDGMRCCIGFVGQQCGIDDDSLLDRSTVEHLGINARRYFPEWMQTSAINLAYGTNDNHNLNDAQRETELKAIFLRNGDEIEFVDGEQS